MLRTKLVLSFFLLVPWLVLPALAAEGPIFTLEDPRGDDHGDGRLLYPLRYYDLAPGDLDILSLEASEEDGGTRFTARFAARVRPTARRTIDVGGSSLDDVARHNFYTTNLDIYVDIDRQEGSGRTQMLPGRKASVDPRYAWERVICLTPRPFDARSALKRILMRNLQRTMKAEPGAVTPEEAAEVRSQIPAEVESHIFFPSRIRVSGYEISFFVPAEVLGGPARTDWAYTIVVSGSDIDLRFDFSNALSVLDAGRSGLMILPVQPGRPLDAFGGGTDGDDLMPPIVDMIVPPGGLTQERILSDYDPLRGRPAVVPAVVPADLR